jgi:hypothetical protein
MRTESWSHVQCYPEKRWLSYADDDRSNLVVTDRCEGNFLVATDDLFLWSICASKRALALYRKRRAVSYHVYHTLEGSQTCIRKL